MKHIILTIKSFIAILCCFWFTNLFSQTVPNNVPVNGLVGWWPFNGNANDESGMGNNGTVFGARDTTDRFGNDDKAYYFNGTYDYIEMAAPTSLLPGYISISVWYKPGTTSITQHLIGKSSYLTASNEMYAMRPDIGSIKRNSNCLKGVGWNAVVFQSSIDTSNWYHQVLTWDGNILKAYLNGLLVSTNNSTPQGGIDFCPGGSLRVGLWWDQDPRLFKGKIDDIGIWNRALTACEIYKLYSGGASIFTSQPVDTSIYMGDTSRFVAFTPVIATNYQWQTDSADTGFRNIFDGNNYSGTNNDTLLVLAATLNNNNQLFRCIVSPQNLCSDTSNTATLSIKAAYIFTGSGNWNVTTNWFDNKIPPVALPSNSEIIINPTGTSECVLNISQTILPGGKITVMPGKNFTVARELRIEQ